jgi:hypothetical protein
MADRRLHAALTLGNLEDEFKFYEGQTAEVQMRIMRESIRRLRSDWPSMFANLHPKLVESLQLGHALKEAVQASLQVYSAIGILAMPRAVVRLQEDAQRARWYGKLIARLNTPAWDIALERFDNTPSLRDFHPVLSLYLTEIGYRKVFKLVNNTLANLDKYEHKEEKQDQADLAAFVVELLTIDLYRLDRSCNNVGGFEGIVWRGFSVTPGEAAIFEEILKEEKRQGTISVPLSILSASRVEATARNFAQDRTKFRKNQNKNLEVRELLWKIHVYSLRQSLAEAYRAAFFEIHFNGLCATNMSHIEMYKEDEVLLRGPFFQVIDVERSSGSTDEPIMLVELVMFNTNRDHGTSTATNVGQDEIGRRVFGHIIRLDRTIRCAELMLKKAKTDAQRRNAEKFTLSARKILSTLPEGFPLTTFASALQEVEGDVDRLEESLKDI